MLRERRDDIDVLPRGMEDELLSCYAQAQQKLRDADVALDERVRELREQIRGARADARFSRKTWIDEQAGRVYQLSTLGRTEFELAELFQLPVERVRTMIRAGSKLEPPLRRDEAPSDCSQSGSHFWKGCEPGTYY